MLRTVAIFLGAFAAGVVLKAQDARCSGLSPTPAQPVFNYHEVRPPMADTDWDLVTIEGETTSARGTVTFVKGRIFDIQGRPIAGAKVEIWQPDVFGAYRRRTDSGRYDPNFQGYGVTYTDSNGGYRFRTIRPVPNPGRAPHINFAVSGEGFKALTTQIYIAGDPRIETDFILSRLASRDDRKRLLVTLVPAPYLENGALLGVFDVVISVNTVPR